MRPGRTGLRRRRFAQGLAGALLGGASRPRAGAAATQTPASPGRARWLESLTWAEAESVLREGRVAVIPIGARCKEHGLHLPLNTDWLTAEYLAQRIARDCPVVMLPTVPYGYYPAFLEYPGSISIGRDVFRDTLEDICRSLARHGQRRIYFLNTGISTLRALEPARTRLAADGIVMEYTDPTTATSAVEERVRKQPAGTHADELETSTMLYMAASVVRMERARRDIEPERGPGPLSRDPKTPTGVYSPTGAWGDPTLATREKGRVLTEALVEHIKTFLQQFAANDYVPAPARERYLKS